jgi:hypothetical protein
VDLDMTEDRGVRRGRPARSEERKPATADWVLTELSARERALNILKVLYGKQDEIKREVTRARLTELTLRRLWHVTRVTDDVLRPVQELLLRSGWALFWARSSYAIIKIKAVEGWVRISSQRIATELDQQKLGQFRKWTQWESLFFREQESALSDDEIEGSNR